MYQYMYEIITGIRLHVFRRDGQICEWLPGGLLARPGDQGVKYHVPYRSISVEGTVLPWGHLADFCQVEFDYCLILQVD